jgi:type IV pilus assembly protein PilB
VLIGEIRDHETAQIAVEASLTGHLVLSTLHTNDAPSAVTRLTEMGIEPFLVGSALDAVLAQRLARRLCSKCKEAYTPTPESLGPRASPAGRRATARAVPGGRLLDLLEDRVQGPPRAARGDARDGGSGAPGRRARSATAIDQVAREEGMVGLRDDGLAKVLAGITSLDEILRVVV